jgi:hypothetical protein
VGGFVKELRKEYQRAFLLEPTKLRRLIEIVHERLGDQRHTASRDSFEVFMSASHREDMTNVDDVLALDNSSKRKIQRLVFVSSATVAGAAAPDREVQVDFASPRVVTSIQKIVAISVRSDDGVWASATLSAVEEQVERTWLARTQPVLILIVMAALLIFVLLSWLLSISLPGQTTFERQANLSSLWLQGPDLDRVEQLVAQQRTLTDDELREIATRQLRNFVRAERPPQSTSQKSWQTWWFIIFPMVVVLGCVIFLLVKCYPTAVFLWGDEEGRFATAMRQRKVLWGVIGGVVGVGLLGKFFYEGVAPWFRRG